MITPAQCIAKFGQPTPANEPKYMTIFQPPYEVLMAFAHVKFNGTIGFPKRIYCNKALEQPLLLALSNIMVAGLTKELKTWDGCFVVRNMRGLSSPSLHSWGVAIDVNAATNQLNKTPTLSKEFVKCFTDAGFDWGGTWTRKDGMHFQLAKL